MRKPGELEFIIAAATFVELHPDRVTPELRAAFDAYMSATPPQGEADCAKCGQRITVDLTGRLIHTTGEVGCRAASYSRLEGKGWDDTIPREWKATLPRVPR